MEQKTLCFEDLEIGRRSVSQRRTMTEADIVSFAGLSGDFNPLHTDEEFAKKGIFGKRIAHGLLGLSISSGLPTNETPWLILAFMSLDWKFTKPIFIGDTVACVSEVKRKKETGADRGIVMVERKLLNQREEVVQEGTFTLLVGKRGTN
ncbi:MAG: MaoC/PaaZ C-terminal domain-containing protein [Pseudomonadota bacterium]